MVHIHHTHYTTLGGVKYLLYFSKDLLTILHFLKIPEQIAKQLPRDGEGRVLYDDFAMAYDSYFGDYEYSSSRSRYHYPKQLDVSGKKTSDRKEDRVSCDKRIPYC